MIKYKCASCDKPKSLTNLVLRLRDSSSKTLRFGICRKCNNLMNANSLNTIQDVDKLKSA